MMSNQLTEQPIHNIKKNTFLTEPAIKNNNVGSKDIQSMHPIVSGVTQMSQTTLLMKRRKELREIDDALNFMKENYIERMEACDNRQRELERKQLEMKEQSSRFDKFITENETKMARAEAKIKSEHRAFEVNSLKKKQLNEQLEKDLAERNKLSKKRDRLLCYKMYLETAIEFSETDYEEIGDILNRYTTLMDTRKDLRDQVKSAEDQTELLRQNIRTLQTEIQNMILVKNSEIHRLQQYLEQLRSDVSKLDLDRQRNDRVSNDQNRDSGQILMTVTNLCNRCRVHMQDPLPILKETQVSTEKHVENLLRIIAARLNDLESMVAKYRDTQVRNK